MKAKTFQTEEMQMTQRELFERCKDLDEAIKEWTPDEAIDETEYWNVRAMLIRDFNKHYDLLFRRMFRSRKIFKKVAWN